MTFREFLKELLVILLVLLGSACSAELLLRWALFHGDAFARWRVPEWYTQVFHVNDHLPGSDDRDKLRVRWGLVPMDTLHAHPELGWCGELDPATLLPRNFDTKDARRDVVLLGAHWQNTPRGSAHPMIDGDTAFQRSCQLVDLSVAGFGPDQDLMLAKRTVGRLDHPLVCIAIDPRDIDLTVREFNKRPKPWFQLTPHGLEQRGVPMAKVDPEEGTGLGTHNGSYLYHLVANRLFGDSVASVSATRSREEGLMWTSLYIVSALLDSSRAHGAKCVAIIDDRVDGWMLRERVDRIAERCSMASVPYRLLSELQLELGITDAHEAMEREVMDWALIPEHGQRVVEWNKVRAIVFKRDEELNEVDLQIKRILLDENWMAQERKKARERGVGLSTILEEDARYAIELDKKKK